MAGQEIAGQEIVKGSTTAGCPAALVRCGGGEEMSVERELLCEHRLELRVNGQTVARLVCTPSDLEDMVLGRLVTEQIISDVSDVRQLELCGDGSRAEVYLRENVGFCQGQTEEPTSGTDNRVLLQRRGQTLRSLPPAEWRQEWIFGLADAFAEDSRLHKSTGGAHACMLGMEDRVLCRTEDIGRHNAMDKAIGYAVREGLDRARCILFTTGRVPVDMVRKAVAAGIPVLASKAVPTKDAVGMAQEYGLHLICRAWPDSFEIYA